MRRWFVGLFLFPALVACSPKDYVGDMCSAAESCYKKAGVAFSVSNCEASVQAFLEGAEVRDCGGEFEDFLDCVEDVACDDLVAFAEQGTTPLECGAAASKYNKCME